MITNLNKLDGVKLIFKEWLLDLDKNMTAQGYTTIITCGLRTEKEQEKLFKEGKSRTLKSKHLIGNAVDLAFSKNGKINWQDRTPYILAANHFKFFMLNKKVLCRWGGDFKTLDDIYHFEI